MAASLVTTLLVGLALAQPAVAQPTGPARAYYWNVSDTSAPGPATDVGRIERLRGFGVSEVHIWLNENRKTPACGYLFHYTEGGAKLWTPARLEAFTRALKMAGITPVFILSPDLRTRSYIQSLSAAGGPLDVAAKVSGVDIELDIEANGETDAPCPADGLGKDAADALLVQAIRSMTPTSRLVVSTTFKYAPRHPVLTTAADALSPQLYGAHYAYTLKETKAGLKYFQAQYPTKPLWPALSVECSPANAAAGRCSETLFTSAVQAVAEAWQASPSGVPKYVVWGEREARRCPPRPLCSVFAADYLSKPPGGMAAKPKRALAARRSPFQFLVARSISSPPEGAPPRH